MTDTPKLEVVGHILLFELEPPLRHAKHAYEWCMPGEIRNLVKSIFDQKAGTALSRAAAREGSRFKLVRKWNGTKSQMVRLRQGGNATKHCPKCLLAARMRWQDEHLLELLEESVSRKKEEK